MADGETVYVDYATRERIAGMTIGGMTIAERVLREAARAGAAAAVIRGTGLPVLPPLPIDVTVISDDPAPPAARELPGDVVAGVRIHDEASREQASRALFQTCRRPHDGLGDRYVIRSISLRLTAVMCRLGLTPNQVTWFNIVIGLAACVVAGWSDGAWDHLAIAGGLMFVQVVLDSSDGELARIRHMHSTFGMWLDNTSDDVIDNLFLAALGIGLGGVWLPIGVTAAVLRTLCALMIHVDVARRGRAGDVLAFQWFFDAKDEALADRFEVVERPSVFGVARAMGRRDLYVLIWAAACLGGVPVVALIQGSVIGVAYFGLAVVHLIVMARRPAS